jgi:WD40 repeat protein
MLRPVGLLNCARFDLSRDGKVVLAIEEDGPVRLIDVATGGELQRWAGDKTVWETAALSPAGAQVASGGSDGMIRLWDTKSGVECARWKAHESGVTALLFDPDGKILVSGGDDIVKLWDLPYIQNGLSELGLNW